MGIGLPMIATPLLAMITDVRTAVLILVIPTVVVNIANILKGGNWRQSISLYWPLAIFSIIGSLIGTRLLIIVSPEYFRPLLAAMLIFYLNSQRLGVGFSWIHRYPHFAIAIFGITAGILGGTVNVMLPALIIYALEVQMPKNVMIQVFNFCFLLGKLTQGAVFAHAGFMTREILWISIPLAIFGLVFMLFGMGIRDKMMTETYHLWLKRLLILMVIVLLVQFVRTLL